MLSFGGIIKWCGLCLLFVIVLVGCGGGGSSSSGGGAGLNINGVYYWGDDPATTPDGTITFTQTGNAVTARGIHYYPGDRPVIGTGTLSSYTLEMYFVLESGETDFTASATFTFSSDASSFEGSFTDSNGDSGPIKGIRI